MPSFEAELSCNYSPGQIQQRLAVLTGTFTDNTEDCSSHSTSVLQQLDGTLSVSAIRLQDW